MDFVIKNSTHRELLIEYLSCLPDKVFDVSVKLHHEKRSDPQNKLYWVIVGLVAKETGNDKDTVHRFFAKEFIGYDIKTIGEERIAIVRSTSALSTEEFSEYLSKVMAFTAQELGIIIPDPNSPIYKLMTNE